jgi:uncharacterized protein (TIGR02391 family)
MHDQPEWMPRECLSLEDLHPAIRDVAVPLYRNGNYAPAILEAYKLLDIKVRELTGLPRSGKDLMAKALNTADPMLSVAVEPGQSGRDEQEGFMLVLMGVMLGVRNPKAHEIVDQRDPVTSFEYLGFASLLLKRIEAAEVKRRHADGDQH